MTYFIRSQSALRVLNLEHAEVMVVLIKLLHATHVNLVLELRDAEVFDFNWVGNGPLEADRHRRQIVGVLDELKLSTAVQSFSLKSDGKGLSIQNLEENA